jgi:hypothetical protein
MKTEIKRSDFPDTPEGQHSYEMKVYTQELASKYVDELFYKELDFLVEQYLIKKNKKNEPRN